MVSDIELPTPEECEARGARLRVRAEQLSPLLHEYLRETMLQFADNWDGIANTIRRQSGQRAFVEAWIAEREARRQRYRWWKPWTW